MKYFASVLLVATLALIQTPAFAQDFDGVFVGEMELVDGYVRKIPLQISLTVSDETVMEDTPSGPAERRIIDGSVLIDDEGGPYAFTKVTYDIDSNVLDMRYSRMGAEDMERLPTSIRLTGQLENDGSLSGRVVSGYMGKIGTFTAKRSDLEHLVVTPKYRGRWEGTTRYTATNEVKKSFVVIEPTSSAIMNPPNFEFGYTPGKVGSYTIGAGQMAFSQVYIDYLRRKVVLVDATGGVNSISLEMDIDLAKGTMIGHVHSRYLGRNAEVHFKRVDNARQPELPAAGPRR